MAEGKIPGYEGLSREDFQKCVEGIIAHVRVKRTVASEKKKTKPANSIKAIAADGGIGLRTLEKWILGDFKKLPHQRTVIDFCDSLGQDAARWFSPHDQLSEEKKTQIANTVRGEYLGIKDSFLEYLKHEPELEFEFANSIIAEEHEGYTGYQFSDYYGVSQYPDMVTAHVIALIQRETERYILSRLNEYRKMSHSFTGEKAKEAFIQYLRKAIDDLDLSNPSMQLAPMVTEEEAFEGITDWSRSTERKGEQDGQS